MFLDIVPFSEHTILFCKKRENLSMRNVFILLKSSIILIATQGDTLKFWLTEEHVVFKMDVKIKKEKQNGKKFSC